MSKLLRTISSIALAVSAPLFAQAGFNGPGRYEITNMKSGKVLDLDRNDQTTVIQFSARGTDNQTWDIRDAGGGYYFLRNGMNGNALEASSDRDSAQLRGVPFNGSPAQQWRIEPGKDGNALIINRAGKAIDVPDGTNRDGAKMQIYGANGDSNQRFTFRRVGGAIFDRDRGPGRDYGDRGDRGDRGYRGDRRDSDRGRYSNSASSYYDERDRMYKMNGDGVCFYRDRDFRGEAFCARVGDDIRNVGPSWNDSFQSVRFFGRVRSVDLYENEEYGGARVTLRRDEPDLGRVRGDRGNFNRRVTSFRVN